MIKKKKKEELALDLFNLREVLRGLDAKVPQVEGSLDFPSVVPGPAHLRSLYLFKTESALRQGHQVISKHSESSRSTDVGKTRRR